MKKEDLIDLIVGKRESEVKMTHYVLMDMTKKRGIKNYTVLTKRELQGKFEFRALKKAMELFGVSASRLTKGIKNSLMIIDGIEYRCGRE